MHRYRSVEEMIVELDHEDLNPDTDILDEADLELIVPKQPAPSSKAKKRRKNP